MIEGHGDDLYKYGKKIVSNFSSNVYNRIDHSGLYQRLNERLSTICSYPEPMPYSLESEIARRYSLTPRQVCVTNGATEAIYLIAQVFFKDVFQLCWDQPLASMRTHAGYIGTK